MRSLEISLTRRVSRVYVCSWHVGKRTDDYADHPVLSSFSWSVVSLCYGRCCLQKWTVIPRTSGLFWLPSDKWKSGDLSRWKDTRPNLICFSGISCPIFLVLEKVTKLILSFSKQALACGVYFSDTCFKYCPFLLKYWNYYSTFLELNFLLIISDQERFSVVFC